MDRFFAHVHGERYDFHPRVGEIIRQDELPQVREPKCHGFSVASVKLLGSLEGDLDDFVINGRAFQEPMGWKYLCIYHIYIYIQVCKYIYI